MCTYIAATLPGDANVAAVAAIAESHKLGWEPLANKHLLAQVEAGSTWFLTTRKYCDCGTALGAVASRAPVRKHDPQSDVPKLRQRGWSEQKIARWLADKSGAEVRREHARLYNPDASTPELESWLRFLNATLVSKESKSVGVLLHFYSGAITGERIAINARNVVRLEDVSSRQLSEMETDVLYRFTS